jgi:lysophospholipase L1-like esterase
LQRIPPQVPVILSALFPIDGRLANAEGVTNVKIQEMNERIFALCRQRPLCAFVNTAVKLADSNGDLQQTFHVGDGVHLNRNGYAIWIEDLKRAVPQ